MTDRSDFWIILLVLATSGLVLVAPVLGRSGHAEMADAAMALAAAGGFGSFLLAGRATLRAARPRARAERKPEQRR